MTNRDRKRQYLQRVNSFWDYSVLAKQEALRQIVSCGGADVAYKEAYRALAGRQSLFAGKSLRELTLINILCLSLFFEC